VFDFVYLSDFGRNVNVCSIRFWRLDAKSSIECGEECFDRSDSNVTIHSNAEVTTIVTSLDLDVGYGICRAFFTQRVLAVGFDDKIVMTLFVESVFTSIDRAVTSTYRLDLLTVAKVAKRATHLLFTRVYVLV